jgi:NAD(P)H-hydrate repair Nnr-like enzyme with NAD(P)H-hydrate dehydratase domain
MRAQAYNVATTSPVMMQQAPPQVVMQQQPPVIIQESAAPVIVQQGSPAYVTGGMGVGAGLALGALAGAAFAPGTCVCLARTYRTHCLLCLFAQPRCVLSLRG